MNTATAPLSACHEAPVKTLPIQADLSWSLLPHVPLFIAAFSFSFSNYYILLPFCLFCLNRHLPLLGPETHSLWACLSLCPSSNREQVLWFYFCSSYSACRWPLLTRRHEDDLKMTAILASCLSWWRSVLAQWGWQPSIRTTRTHWAHTTRSRGGDVLTNCCRVCAVRVPQLCWINRPHF